MSEPTGDAPAPDEPPATDATPEPAAEAGAAAEPEPDPTPRCEVCGTELDADQTYCLECGAPTPLAPALRGRRRELALLAGALAILGIGAGVLGFAMASDDGGDGAATVTAPTLTAPTTAPVVPPIATVPTVGTLPPDTSVTAPPIPGTTPTQTGVQTVTGPTTAPDPGTTTTDATTTGDTVSEAPEPTETDPPDDGLSAGSDWPAGRTAWTAILSSVRDESDARAARTRVRGSGEPAGVLYSSDHPELNPGFWVVFSGTFSSRTTAITQADKLRPQFPDAYAREISGEM